MKSRIEHGWKANCRGIDPDGSRIVHIYGSNESDAVDVARAIESIPQVTAQRDELLAVIKAIHGRAKNWGYTGIATTAETTLAKYEKS